ncbi:MAG: nuclease-related domain-containing protein [Proteobacteria bacterium]|nr:nuclease-related domain-containing protein [Pseudomonadota bacterium]
MIIKSADEKQLVLETLEQLRQRPDATDTQRKTVEKEIKIFRAGIKGEEESAYLIDFDFKASKNTAVIHDLRLESNGRVAQIDHLLIHRKLTVFVLETKHFNCKRSSTDAIDYADQSGVSRG